MERSVDVEDVRIKMEPGVPVGQWQIPDWHPAHPGMVPHMMLPYPYQHHTKLYRPHLPGVKATLVNSALWRQFDAFGNEMIITKTGRSMFPRLAVRVEGLDPDTEYNVLMEMRLASPNRCKYSGGRWVPSGAADAQHAQLVYVHPESPAKGSAWAARDITFRRSNNAESAKLTNNTQTKEHNNLVLTSMHKYRPHIHVVRVHDNAVATFDFSETDFVAVTAYQNNAIKKMKINNNPFAKGFRETGLSHCKRKQKMRMGAEEVLRSPPPLPLSPPLSPAHDDSSVSASSVGSAPGSAPYSPSALSETPPPEPSPAATSRQQLGFSIRTILDPSFGPQQHQHRVPPTHHEWGESAKMLCSPMSSMEHFVDPYSWAYSFPYHSVPVHLNHPMPYYPAQVLDDLPRDLTTSRRSSDV